MAVIVLYFLFCGLIVLPLDELIIALDKCFVNRFYVNRHNP